MITESFTQSGVEPSREFRNIWNDPDCPAWPMKDLGLVSVADERPLTYVAAKKRHLDQLTEYKHQKSGEVRVGGCYHMLLLENPENSGRHYVDDQFAALIALMSHSKVPSGV